MIRHTLIEIQDNGYVDLTLPGGGQVRFAGVELAGGWLDWADENIGEQKQQEPVQ